MKTPRAWQAAGELFGRLCDAMPSSATVSMRKSYSTVIYAISFSVIGPEFYFGVALNELEIHCDDLGSTLDRITREFKFGAE